MKVGDAHPGIDDCHGGTGILGGDESRQPGNACAAILFSEGEQVGRNIRQKMINGARCTTRKPRTSFQIRETSGEMGLDMHNDKSGGQTSFGCLSQIAR